MTMGLRPQPLRPKPAPVARSGPPMFVFGVGAAKAGTTWLYRYLRAHRECHLRGHKELQYFDAIDKSQVRFQADRLAMQLRELEASLPGMAPEKRRQRFADMLDMRDFLQVLLTCHVDPNAYFRYMMGGLGSQKLVADITPNYASLSTGMLAKMVGVANETRFIYLMRDPVARLWSNVRMEAAMKVPTGADIEATSRVELARVLSGGTAIGEHSDYAQVLAKLEAAIPQDQRLIMFYEDLMTPVGVRTLCRFLGIKPMAVDFALRANEGQSVKLTQDESASVRRFLRPQYEAVASRFPVLPKAWQKTMAEGFA